MSFEKQTVQIEKPNHKKPSLKRTLGTSATAALVAGGALLGVNHINDNAEQEQLRKEQVAAEAIALGYNCEILEIDDTHEHPRSVTLPGELHDGDLRSTVNITLRMQKRPEAIPYFEQYKSDTAVQWFPLRPGGLMHIGSNGETIPVTVSDDHNADLVDLNSSDPANPSSWEVTIPFYPRTHYPDETLVDIVMEQEVVISDDEKSYTTTGVIPCGTMKIFNGVWGKSGIPSELKPTTHTEVSEWQSN